MKIAMTSGWRFLEDQQQQRKDAADEARFAVNQVLLSLNLAIKEGRIKTAKEAYEHAKEMRIINTFNDTI